MPKAAPARAPAAAVPPRHCAVRLRAAVSNLTRRLRSALPPDALSVAKLSVLAQLHRRGALTPSELARHERVKLQSLSRLLAELEGEGRLARRAHPGDGRQTLLSLTRQGTQQLGADVHRREASLVRAIESALTAPEQALLLAACALIDRVADAVAAAPSEGGA